jgi:S-adenosylmethionine:tRNA ribosyltransferase-isomerase
LERAGHSKVELTLHVGAGTFKPLGEGEIEAHQMHDEEIILSQQWLEEYLGHEGPKIAVGTTSLRSLESFHWIGAKFIETGELSPLGQFEAYTLNPSLTVTQTYSALLDALKARGIMELALHTQLMIKPGYSFKTVKGIVTNFHQSGSTLLLLVSAGVGEQWRDIYTHALDHDYRFLSYGDSSLLLFQGN